MPMTPRERVLTTLNHEEPDRVPLVIGVSNATGIKMEPYQQIKQILGVQAPDDYLYDWPGCNNPYPGKNAPESGSCK